MIVSHEVAAVEGVKLDGIILSKICRGVNAWWGSTTIVHLWIYEHTAVSSTTILAQGWTTRSSERVVESPLVTGRASALAGRRAIRDRALETSSSNGLPLVQRAEGVGPACH